MFATDILKLTFVWASSITVDVVGFFHTVPKVQICWTLTPSGQLLEVTGYAEIKREDKITKSGSENFYETTNHWDHTKNYIAM